MKKIQKNRHEIRKSCLMRKYQNRQRSSRQKNWREENQLKLLHHLSQRLHMKDMLNLNMTFGLVRQKTKEST
ncbi:hypothetical protein RHMOL_Rhmol02G0226100 [Rhododendron molle]|uniref:Uncharacterized protein n=1 Tax=Rhododendron molle TaxID=49168 RepID=A0ACC0PUE1_RHOML|nr:hypothetical protein RHMOL_Rhmol02G0226100 [Rhododendron molle]